MKLSCSDSELAFRDEARDWLAANVPTRALPPVYTAEGVAAHREWEKTLHRAGYPALHWPQEYGGGGADFMRLEQAYGTPREHLARIANAIFGSSAA
jgi:alkylation response protein AidB-like acyl-CoA dehydrogenase